MLIANFAMPNNLNQMFLFHIIVVMIIYQRNMYDEVVILLLAVMLFSYYYIVNSMPYKHHWLLLSDHNINIAIFICEGSIQVIFYSDSVNLFRPALIQTIKMCNKNEQHALVSCIPFCCYLLSFQEDMQKQKKTRVRTQIENQKRKNIYFPFLTSFVANCYQIVWFV